MAYMSEHHKYHLRCGIESRRLDRRTQERVWELVSPVIHVSGPRVTNLLGGDALSPGHGKGPEVWDV
jgi:hypothetical protein